MANGSSTEFGGLLRRLRLAAGFSQEALAERAGLSVDAVAALERGRRQRPRPFTVRLLADALSLDAKDRAALVDASTPASGQGRPDLPTSRAQALPAPLTSFVGRERELRRLRRRLPETRLLTLTGAGGTGKTRLAIELAAAEMRENGGPAWFVALDTCHEPDLVPQVVSAAVGVPEVGAGRPRDAVLRWLREADGLVVLDNCEHLLGAVGSLVQALLLSCPGIRVLATSRTILGVPGEVTWRVPSLQLSDPESVQDLETLGRVEAIRLFVERAILADPGFRLTEDNASAVAAVCRRLDGIPLAIELAAARARVLAPAQMLERLRDAPGFLTGGPATTTARQRTLRNAIQWSYELLPPAAQTLFERLSVFSGGFQLEAAEVVTGDDVLDPLTCLVEHSLVIAEPSPLGDMRYRVLEVLRQFGEARLNASGEADQLQRRHVAYYADFAGAAELELMGEDQIRWVATVRQERENVRAALAWSLSGRTDASEGGADDRLYQGLRLAAALWFLWYADGAPNEGLRWLETLCARSQAEGDARRSSTLRARALAGAAWLAYVCSQHRKATSLAEHSLELLQSQDEPEARVNAWSTLGALAVEAQDYDRATGLFHLALELAQRAGLNWWVGASLTNLGFLGYRRGDLEGAARFAAAAVAKQRVLKDAVGLANSLLNLGGIRFAQGDAGSALSHYLECLRLLYQLGSTSLTAEVLEAFAEVLLAQGRAEVGTRVLSSAAAYRERIGAPALEWREPAMNGLLSRLREELGAEPYASAWAAGRMLSIDQAVAEVLSVQDLQASGGQ